MTEVITPKIWGPHIWQTMHYISLGYPNNPTEEDKHNYKSFFLLLKNVLPCKICSNHYHQNLNSLPLTDNILSNKNNLIKWVIDLHNIVNKMKNKDILSYDEAMRHITKNRLCNHNNNIILWIMLIVLSILIIIAFYMKKR